MSKRLNELVQLAQAVKELNWFEVTKAHDDLSRRHGFLDLVDASRIADVQIGWDARAINDPADGHAFLRQFEAPCLSRDVLLHSAGMHLVGKALGKYRLTGVIGAGGSGAVVLHARDKGDAEYAVKILPKGITRSSSSLRRFRKEAQMACQARLTPRAAYGVKESFAYYVMRYSGSRLLHSEMHQRGCGSFLGPVRSRLGVSRSIEVVHQLARELAALHRKGIVHRDVKPQNVTLDPEVKIIDFGIACKEKEAGRISRAGTAGYASPEQSGMSRFPLTCASDQFSVGLLMYELLTGKSLFETAFGSWRRIRFLQPLIGLSILFLNPFVSVRAALVCQQALAWNPKRRHASMKMVHDKLKPRRSASKSRTQRCVALARTLARLFHRGMQLVSQSPCTSNVELCPLSHRPTECQQFLSLVRRPVKR